MGYRIGNVELGPIGIYDVSKITGSMAAGLAANAPILSIRWTSANAKFVLERISIDGIIATTGFAAGQAVFNCFKATAFSAADTGGNDATPAAGKQKRLTSFADSAVTKLLVASTGTLTAGTRTKDTNPFASQNLGFGTATNTNLLGLTPVDLYNAQARQGFPIILGANEGIIVEATVPATGVWIANFTISWAETSPNIPI